ncbi:Alpha/Beta hydrolase protein [Mycena rosella]|uniref:Carboxylic ester hydrolase n=1 Tax=Mycena rosella TaxID=1033263 RepID=A0AAD7M9F9_MYCRO|nr:Alpha/Beta hydrolase protein [Mycena rosella]
MQFFFALASALYAYLYSYLYYETPVTIKTTSGVLQGLQTNGVLTFKGIVNLASLDSKHNNATGLGPACVQQFPQFPLTSAGLYEFLFNNPADPPPESEDCLFLNVWAPVFKPQSPKRPVLVWIHGGALAFGTASVPVYDGASIAANQDIILVSLNYRTNVFGFPGSPELPIEQNNLGFLDQELALQWVQSNIAHFGGDPKQVTIMGQSAGSQSVSAALQRHPPGNAPFRAGIMLSGAHTSTPKSPAPAFARFNTFSAAFGCTQAPGPARLACLKQVPAPVIRNFTNGPTSDLFQPVADDVTMFSDPLERIRTGLTARVPFIIGNTQDDGSIVAVGLTDLAEFLSTTFAFLESVTPAQARAFYPGLNDSLVVSAIARDVIFLCPAELWSGAAVGAGISNVYRYTYGPVFADLQLFPGAGAWHCSELFEIFGTFNVSTATPAEVTLSRTMQTLIANFVKDPAQPPADGWPKYVPGNGTRTLAKLAYEGNVQANDVVQAVESDAMVRVLAIPD